MNDIVSRWLATMLHLPEIHHRFKTVVVDHQDAVRCIQQWDGPATLFYVDPPYVGAEEYYQGGFNAQDHERLAEALNGCRAKVVLSYYPHETVSKLYPENRWHRLTVETRTTACGNFKRDLLTDVPALKESVERTELVLMNFDPAVRMGGQKNLSFMDLTSEDE
jgi:site-specific DNA-adenine methylase